MYTKSLPFATLLIIHYSRSMFHPKKEYVDDVVNLCTKTNVRPLEREAHANMVIKDDLFYRTRQAPT